MHSFSLLLYQALSTADMMQEFRRVTYAIVAFESDAIIEASLFLGATSLVVHWGWQEVIGAAI